MAKHVVDDLDIWAREARKYELSYGNYVRLTERHGMLPPPEPRKTPITKKTDTPTRVCDRCGNEFSLHKCPSGNYSLAKFCADCRDTVRRNNAKGTVHKK